MTEYKEDLTEISREDRIYLGCRYYGLYTLGLAITESEKIDENCAMDNIGVPFYQKDLTERHLAILNEKNTPNSLALLKMENPMIGQITINPLGPTAKPVTLNYKCASRLIQGLGNYYLAAEDDFEEITADNLRQIFNEYVDEGVESEIKEMRKHIDVLKETDKFIIFRHNPTDVARQFHNAILLGAFSTKEELIDFQQKIKWEAIVDFFEHLSKENPDFTTTEQPVKPPTDSELQYVL